MNKMNHFCNKISKIKMIYLSFEIEDSIFKTKINLKRNQIFLSKK